MDGLVGDDRGAPLIGVNFNWAAFYNEYLVLRRPWNKGWAALPYQALRAV